MATVVPPFDDDENDEHRDLDEAVGLRAGEGGLAPVVPISGGRQVVAPAPGVPVGDGRVFEMVDGQAIDCFDDRDSVDSLVDEDGDVSVGAGFESEGVVDRPLVPTWLSSRETLVDHAAEAGRRCSRWLVFHLLRLPLYLLRLAAMSPAGVTRGGRWLVAWVKGREEFVDAKDVMRKTGRGDINELRESHSEAVKTRAAMALGGFFLAASIGLVALLSMASWQRIIAGTCVVVGLGVFGRPTSTRSVVERVRYDRTVAPKVTEPLLVQALRAAGAEPKGARPLQVIQPPVKIRTGWEAVFSLGVPATVIMERVDKVATELGRAVNCVWLTSDPDEAAGWLRVVVTRRSLRNARMPDWPFRHGGRFDWFHDRVPVGIDETGELILSSKRAVSTVYGGIMGSGKTVSMIVQVLGQAVDPRVELHINDLKGGTDWLDFAGIAHFLRAGSDVEDHEAVLDDLRGLNSRMDARFRILRELPDDIRSPKTTSALADMRHLDLHPIVVVIDETQELFDPLVCPNFWKEYTGLVSRLIKKGRAAGITVEAGSQEINKKTLPIAGLCQVRHCHAVHGHVAVDLVLSTGAYSAGYRPDELTAEDAGIGYHGSGKNISLCRSYFLDPDADDILDVVTRLRAERTALGRLSGMAAGDDTPAVNTEGALDRLARLWPAGVDRLQWVELVQLHHDDQPDDYPAVDDLTDGIPEPVERAVAQLSSQLARDGLSAVTVRSGFRPKRGQRSTTRRGLIWDDVVAARANRSATSDKDPETGHGDTDPRSDRTHPATTEDTDAGGDATPDGSEWDIDPGASSDTPGGEQ